MNFYAAVGDSSLDRIGDLLIELMIDDYLDEPTDEKLAKIDLIDKELQ